MPVVVTNVHDAVALAATYQRLYLEPPLHSALRIDTREIVGWVVRLRGVRSPVACDTLTGLIAYCALIAEAEGRSLLSQSLPSQLFGLHVS
jgi:hypothetical protein